MGVCTDAVTQHRMLRSPGRNPLLHSARVGPCCAGGGEQCAEALEANQEVGASEVLSGSVP